MSWDSIYEAMESADEQKEEEYCIENDVDFYNEKEN